MHFLNQEISTLKANLFNFPQKFEFWSQNPFLLEFLTQKKVSIFAPKIAVDKHLNLYDESEDFNFSSKQMFGFAIENLNFRAKKIYWQFFWQFFRENFFEFQENPENLS